MIIDGHAHACGSFLTIEGIEEKLKEAGADMVVLTPGERNSRKVYKLSDKAEKKPYSDVVSGNNRLTRLMIGLIGAMKQIPEGNEDVFLLKQKAPDKIRQMYWVNYANWEKLEKDYQRMHFEGIKLHQCWEKFEMGGSWFEEVVKWASDKELPVFIHQYSPEDVKQLIFYIKRNPQAKIIIAHLYGMEFFLKEDLSYFDNVYFDISNCYFVSGERIVRAYKRFGGTKLLLGSDTPYGEDSLKKTIELVESLKIPLSDKERILGENIKQLMKL